MKPLNEYIQESLLDDEDELVEKSDITLIEEFIKNNYRGQYKIHKYPVNGKYQVSSTNGDIHVVNPYITQLTNGLFEWDTIKECFYCGNCELLKTLEGAPKKCDSFYCNYCTSLESLKDAPKDVKGEFNCNNCSSLESFEGAPKKCDSFYCYGCISLKTLKGAPEDVKGEFNCNNCTSIISLKGAPKKVGRDFYCNNCSSLKTLKGAPEKVGRRFSCRNCVGKFTENDVKTVCDVNIIIT